MAEPGGSLISPELSEATWRAVFDALPDALALVDADERLVAANDALAMRLSRSEKALVGREMGRNGGFGEANARSGEVSGGFGKVITRHPVAGGPLSIVRFAHPAAPRSDDAIEAFRRFSAALSHDIKNPLTAIRGAAQVLRRTGGGDAQELCALIEDEVGRVAGIIDRMTGAATGGGLATRAVNVHAPCEYALRRMRALDPARQLASDYDPSLPEALADEAGLIQLLDNLLQNAAEVSDCSSITLRTRFTSGRRLRDGEGRERDLPIEVSVLNDGTPPAPDVAASLLHPLVSTKGSGRGLGLAIADRLARDMGGALTWHVDDAARRTVFTIHMATAHG